MDLIYFLINAATMEHPDEGTVSKLRLYKCFHRYTLLFSTLIYGESKQGH